MKKTLILSLVIIVLLLLIQACSNGGVEMNSKYDKVIVIGIDGMDPKITDKLIDEDKLPNFKKLADEGSYMNLNTSYPPHSPVAWTSIATGTNPGKHNIFDFIRRNKENYIPELSLSKSVSGIAGTDYESYVKTDPFWRITSNKKIPTNVIRWPVTFPPERVEGNLLSGLGVPDIKGFLSGYSLYSSQDLESDKASNKLIKVDIEDEQFINTYVWGPRTKKGGEIVELKVPMELRIQEESVDIIINAEKYNVKLNGWSDWIRVKFKAGMFKNVYSIFRVYVISLEPFEMYVTTMQIDPMNPVLDISYPAKYSEDLAKEIGSYYTLGMPEETDGLTDGRLTDEAFLEHIEQIEDERDKMFWKEFETFKKWNNGVYAFVYDSSDRVQHVFWDEKLLDNKTDGFSLNPAVEDYFVKKDKFIGEVLEQLDNNTLLLVVSDHGFTSFEKSVSVNTWLAENGFMTLNRDIKEGDDGALFRDVDWSNTKAYSVGFNGIFINVKDREGQGIVENREEVVNEIKEKLEALEDDGRMVINKAYKREEIYNGPLINEGPDLVVGFNPGYRMSWQNAIGGFTKEIININDKKWDGDHLVDAVFVPGVLFSNQKINKESANQLDIAPTILDALGLDVPEQMDGNSLLE